MQTINDNVDVETVRHSLGCIVDQVDGFPSVDAIQLTVNSLKNNVTVISQGLTYLHDNLTTASVANASLDAAAAVGQVCVAHAFFRVSCALFS
jgi:hypothetical protein